MEHWFCMVQSAESVQLKPSYLHYRPASQHCSKEKAYNMQLYMSPWLVHMLLLLSLGCADSRSMKLSDWRRIGHFLMCTLLRALFYIDDSAQLKAVPPTIKFSDWRRVGHTSMCIVFCVPFVQIAAFSSKRSLPRSPVSVPPAHSKRKQAWQQ
jgi:hypothetical protein